MITRLVIEFAFRNRAQDEMIPVTTMPLVLTRTPSRCYWKGPRPKSNDFQSEWSVVAASGSQLVTHDRSIDFRVALPHTSPSLDKLFAHMDGTQTTQPYGRTFAFTGPILATMVISLFSVGCGGSSEAPVAQATGEQPAVAAPNKLPEPTEVVSQFLDRMRRGGDGNAASDLLTQLAQQEMVRIGRPLQLPGSPDTTFEVRNSFRVPETEDRVWVQTYLREPDADSGQSVQYEVVWTLRQETEGWRISGFHVDQGEGLDPLEFNFENGDEFNARLSAIEQTPETTTR